ncbi:MAG: hypothetical protein LBB90_01115, partial [Tannerella sp.]|nr:hypothetical protein [Tannerella sp.]
MKTLLSITRFLQKKSSSKHIFTGGLLAATVLLCAGCTAAPQKEQNRSDAPRIVNIINFIRQLEPRTTDPGMMQDVLYETVVEQVNQLKRYGLPGTFLLQYDALVNPKYQALLKNELTP